VTCISLSAEYRWELLHSLRQVFSSHLVSIGNVFFVTLRPSTHIIILCYFMNAIPKL
jgi:hypothetical protein